MKSTVDLAPTIKSKVRGVRLPTWISEVLDREAAERGVSANALVVSILTKYVEWDRFAEKFGYVSIPNRILKSAFEGMKESQAESIANSHSQLASELASFWFQMPSLENLMRFSELTNKYSGLYRYEEVRDRQSVMIVLKHNLGRRWSEFIKTSAENSFRGIIDAPLKIQIFEGSIALRIPISNNQSPLDGEEP